MNGVFRAIGAGVALDLCNHGILLVGTKLYERGASLGQVFAFDRGPELLFADPHSRDFDWLSTDDSFHLCSAMIALVSGILVDRLLCERKPFAARVNS